jgi:geranylgeranyl diphosphate synthase type II
MPQKLNIKKYIADIRKKVNLAIGENLPHGNDRVSRAMRYAVLNGGKRLRPVLFIAVFESLGGRIDSGILTIASSIEFIHAFSLIQDDLPALDNDDYRRGKPAAHKVFGEDIAILASDSLLNEAYKILLEEDALDAGLKVKIASELTRAVKILISGQEKDLALTPRKPVGLLRLKEIYLGKTAALITSCMKIAGILRSLKANGLSRLNSFGMKLGMSYQVLDDILNVTAKNKAFKGRKFSDERKGKITYVSLIGVKKSKEAVTNLIKAAKREIAKINRIDKEKLYSLCDFLLRRAY